MNTTNNAISATIGGEKIENQKINLLDKFFKIPPYQRLYEWGENEINELLDDIKKAFDEKKNESSANEFKEYFIGNITASKKNENGQDIYVLIDGQQRLTTLWFIGFYLASQKCSEWQKKWQEFIISNGNLRIAMPIRDNEENALRELAANIKKENKLTEFLKKYNIHNKIIKAFECIENWFSSFIMVEYGDSVKNDKDLALKDFADFIYNKVCFVFVTLAENTDLNRFFVRMNNRGKQLEKHEILKARLLKKIQENDKNEWQQYAKIWDLCSDMDKYIFQSASDRKVLDNFNSNLKSDSISIETSNESDNDNSKSQSEIVKLTDIIEKYKIHKDKKSKDKDTPSKVKSIVDFSTFLLHCYKLFTKSDIGINKDKLLEIMWENKNNKTYEITFKNNGQCCKEFIKYMLYYRVLFDYFVIKNNEKLGDKGKNPYTIKRLDKDSNGYYNVAKSNVFENLAMIQNYLRVARQGEKQNYHHWLTPFLQKLGKENLIKCDLVEIKSWNPNEICKILDNKKDESKQDELVSFLKNLDTKLAMAQLNQTNENDLLDTTNAVLQNANVEISQNLDSINWDFLNNGTTTPHYWFYRLEYYLWKLGKFDSEILEKQDSIKIYNTKLGEGKDKVTFKDIFEKNLFHFRLLGSIEHFSAVNRQPQRTDNSWDIDIFGNLALISSNLNSSLSNQIEKYKKDEIINQLKCNRIESLKYFIMCANLKSDEWTYENAKFHQNQMLEILIHSLNGNKAQ